jgi:chaperonin cofactor prefoldin
MKNHKETQLSSEELQKELAACERTLAVLGSEEASLLTRTRNLKDDRARCMKGHGTVLSSDRTIPENHRRVIAAADQELPGLENRLTEIQPQVRAAATRLSEIREALSKAAQTSVERLMSEALLSAPSHEKFITAKQKLADLRVALEGAKTELQRAKEAAARALVDISGVDCKARMFIEQGEIPQQNEVPPSLSAEVRRTTENLEVLTRAVEIQRQTMDAVGTELTGELTRALNPVRTALVQKIASGFREAAEATSQADLLQDAVRREAGSDIAPVNFHQIKPIRSNDHPFLTWITGMRRDGFEV